MDTCCFSLQVPAINDCVLKCIPLEDCELLWQAYSEDPEATGYFIDVGFRDMGSAKEAINQWRLKTYSAEGLYMGVYIGSKLVGHIRSGKHSGLPSEAGQGYSLEYWLCPSFQRVGILTRAIPVFLDFASALFTDACYFEIVCHPDNQRSIALARRLGFLQVRRDGNLRESLPRIRLRRPANGLYCIGAHTSDLPLWTI